MTGNVLVMPLECSLSPLCRDDMSHHPTLPRCPCRRAYWSFARM